MSKLATNKIQPQNQPRRNPWNNLVDFLRRVNASRRSEIILYNRRMSLLSKIAKTISSEEEVSKILQLILNGAVDLTKSSSGVIFFKHEVKLEALETFGIKVVKKDLIIRPWRGIVGHVLSSKRSYLCNNTDRDRYFIAWSSGKRIHSELAVPIIIDGEVYGVIIVSSRDYNKYSKVDETLLKDLSQNASIAIKKAKAYDELERLKNFSDNVINSSSLGMLVTDINGETIRFNKAAENLFSPELLRLGEKVIFPKDVSLPTIDEMIKILKLEKVSLVFETIRHFQNRGREYFDLRVDPLFNRQGEIVSVLLTKENVTKKVLLDQRIQEMNKILERKVLARTKRLKKLNEKLRESLSSKMQFVADVSHELRTPLNIILGNIELLQKSHSRIPVHDKEAMRDVVIESRRIATKLENLITLIHEGARADKIALKQFEFSKMINEVLEMTRKLSKEKRIEVMIKNNLKLEFIGDRERIKEMILNISTNAVKYNQYNGKIILDVQIKDNNIEVLVSDTGIGIAKVDLPFIFDRFYRAKDIERYKKKGGSGIGLAVSRWIARAHGGDIKVESRVGTGSKFTVVLPFSR
jgi:signal transduction histidine kinase/putative methionine-R-sulfoxide reductase with GAF domain